MLVNWNFYKAAEYILTLPCYICVLSVTTFSHRLSSVDQKYTRKYKKGVYELLPLKNLSIAKCLKTGK